MKLGEAVAYPGLEGVSFLKNMCVCVCVCVYVFIYLAAPALSCAQGSSFFVVAKQKLLWDLVPWQWIKPWPPALGAQILATGPPGKSSEDVFIWEHPMKSACAQ